MQISATRGRLSIGCAFASAYNGRFADEVFVRACAISASAGGGIGASSLLSSRSRVAKNVGTAY